MPINRNPRHRASRDIILAMVQQRPCSIQQLTRSFNARSNEVVKLLSDMVRDGQLVIKSTNEGLFVVPSDMRQRRVMPSLAPARAPHPRSEAPITGH